MLVTFPAMVRITLEPSDLSDIAPCTRVEWVEGDPEGHHGRWEIEFSGDLTPRQREQVRLRCMTQDAEAEGMFLGLADAIDILRPIRDSTGILSPAQLSNYARASAAMLIRLAKFSLDDMVDD